MTRAKDISKIVTDANLSGTLDVAGAFTSQGIDDNADATAITIDSSERVGIGNSTPSSYESGATNLVVGNTSDTGMTIASGTSNLGSIFFADGTSGGAKYEGQIRYNHGSNFMMFATGGSERMRIDSAGNIGIGTSTVNNNLHILGSSGLRIVNSDDTTNLALLNFDNNESPALSLYSNDTTTVRIHSEGTSFFNGGNVGIGTSSPVANNAGARTLQIDGAGFGVDIRLTNTPTGATAANGSAVILDSTNFYLWNYENAFTAFGTNNSERMRITSGGNVHIGGATAYGNANALTIATSGANVQAITTNSTSSSPYYIGRFYSGGSEIGSIYYSGSATAYASSSDHRLKENVTADWDATTRLKQLNPVRFNFIANADTTVDGFLAHEVQPIVPEAIIGTHNEVDADGNPVYQGIDQSKLVPLLVKTIQELEARIVALETA